MFCTGTGGPLDDGRMAGGQGAPLLETYAEEVKVYTALEPRLIGSARFKGRACQETPGGLWSWRGVLTDPSFEPREVWDVHDIRLEFFDGAAGRAFCTGIDYPNGRVNLEVTGEGVPPRM